MFNSDDFRQIINQTSELLDNLTIVNENDMEELQMRIKSNIHALKIMGNQIEDTDLKQRAEEIIRSIAVTASQGEKSAIRFRKNITCNTRSDFIDSELFRNAQELKAMATKFNKTLDSDKNIISNLAVKMKKNTMKGTNNLKNMNKSDLSVSSSTYFFISLILFIIMYFLIKL